MFGKMERTQEPTPLFRLFIIGRLMVAWLLTSSPPSGRATEKPSVTSAPQFLSSESDGVFRQFHSLTRPIARLSIRPDSGFLHRTSKPRLNRPLPRKRS